MDKKIRVALLGVGCMGEAMLRGLTKRQHEIEVVGVVRREDQVRELARVYPSAKFVSNLESLPAVDVLVVCVKPQQLDEVATTLQGKISPNCVVISILAGIGISKLQDRLSHKVVIRAMPNTPGQRGVGYTGWCPSSEVSDQQAFRAEEVLKCLGRQRVYLKEELLDTVTAISGSGPGTFAYLIQAYIEAGVKNGMTRADAREAVLQTVWGTADYLLQTSEHPAILQDSVTSPGGTTAAIVYELDKAGVRAAIATSIDAGINRCRELRRI